MLERRIAYTKTLEKSDGGKLFLMVSDEDIYEDLSVWLQMRFLDSFD